MESFDPNNVNTCAEKTVRSKYVFESCFYGCTGCCLRSYDSVTETWVCSHPEHSKLGSFFPIETKVVTFDFDSDKSELVRKVTPKEKVGIFKIAPEECPLRKESMKLVLLQLPKGSHS